MELTLSLLKMVVGLVVVIVLINLCLKYLQKVVAPQDEKLRIIKKVTVSKTSALGIVQVLDRYYLMSLAEQGSTVISELTLTEVQELVQPTVKHTNSDFAAILKEKTLQLKGKVKQHED